MLATNAQRVTPGASDKRGHGFSDLPRALAWLVAWAWTIIAGIGGLGLIITLGPLPLTNGWFALFSGISSCPLTAWLLKEYAGVKLSGWARFGIAVLLICDRAAGFKNRRARHISSSSVTIAGKKAAFNGPADATLPVSSFTYAPRLPAPCPAVP